MKIVTFFNQKGGVGKSTLTFNIAYYFSLNYKTVIWDLDTQKALSLFTGVIDEKKDKFEKVFKDNNKIKEHIYKTNFENLFIIPSNENLRNIILELDEQKKSRKILDNICEEIDNDFDYMFIDSRPSKSLLIENIIKAVHHIYIPIIPNHINYFLLEDNINFIDYCKSKEKIEAIVLNAVDHRKKTHSETIEKIKHNYKKYFIDHYIPISSKVEEMQVRQKPLELFAKSNKATIALKELYKIIHSRI